MPTPSRRKTMRRTRQQAQTLARRLTEYGCMDVTVERVTQTDWAVTYTEKVRDAD